MLKLFISTWIWRLTYGGHIFWKKPKTSLEIWVVCRWMNSAKCEVNLSLDHSVMNHVALPKSQIPTNYAQPLGVDMCTSSKFIRNCQILCLCSVAFVQHAGV